MTDLSPHIKDGATPLENLMYSALRRYGEFSPGQISGDVAPMFIEFANEILDDFNDHPYRANYEDVPPYISISDSREVPDPIIINGLIAQFASQQGHKDTIKYLSLYQKQLNQKTWTQYEKEHHKGQKIELSQPDMPAPGSN